MNSNHIFPCSQELSFYLSVKPREYKELYTITLDNSVYIETLLWSFVRAELINLKFVVVVSFFFFFLSMGVTDVFSYLK